jgi:uncharacterized protein (DUF1015 family)
MPGAHVTRVAIGARPWYAGAVPRFEPFPGVRYDPDRVTLARVVAPPYDVISPDQRAELAAQSPYSSVLIELPQDAPDLERYAAAARQIVEWEAAGILRRDPTARFYGYRMSHTDPGGRARQTVGVLGALGLEPPGTAGIFPHERTTPKAKSDRLQLLQATRLNTSPIWGLSLAAGLSDALDPPPTADPVVDGDGIAHQCWPITDPAQIAAIVALVSSAPIVIADGHHRFETALTYQAQRQAEAADPGSDHAYDLVLALVVELVEDQLSVQAIHRLVSGLPNDFDLVAALARHFVLDPTDGPDATIADRMAAADSLALLTPDGTWLLHPTEATRAAAGHDLDSSRLEVALADLPDHEVVYQHGWDLAAAAVERGEAQAALLLRPVSVEQIASTGRGGERMPPKTTFFWPKPRTGFVFREVPG